MTDLNTTTAFAPASIGNVGVGFDMLGLALEGVGDRVTAALCDEPGVHIDGVLGLDGQPHPYLSTEATSNTASIAVASLWTAVGVRQGVRLTVAKGVPLQSGMGSSAASAVAGVVAANALLDEPLPVSGLLPHALAGERFASGGVHADNVAPSLFGGLVLCPPHLLPEVLPLPVPDAVSAVLLHPEMQVNTAQARRGLARSCSLQDWVLQQGCFGAFVAACMTGDVELLGKSLRDVIVEPQRKAAVPCFDAVREAALGSGALGFSLSGSGPSLFCLCPQRAAANIATAMAQACRGTGIECQTFVSSLEAPGASVVD